MKTKSILFTKPIERLPKRIIYKSSETSRIYDDINGCKTYVHTYNMYDIQANEFVATMKAAPVLYRNKDWEIYPIKLPYKAFYISFIESVDSGLGYGTDLINLAKAESRKTGCGGRVHLIASRTYSPRRPPHLFYRKLGFESISKALNDTMDFYISIGKQLPLEYADNIEMYLPVKAGKKNNVFSSLLKFFKEKFTKR